VTGRPLNDGLGAQICRSASVANSLRLLVDVGGHGAFVAAFRNRAEIVLAYLNRQSPKSAAPALAHRPHSFSDVAMFCPSVARMVHENGSQGLNGPRGTYYPWPRPCRSADWQAQATAVEQRAGPH
jgi:hypothetical protein